MSSGEVNFLLLRNTRNYNPDGSYANPGSVFTIDNNGASKFSADLILSTVTAQSSMISTITASTLTANVTSIGQLSTMVLAVSSIVDITGSPYAGGTAATSGLVCSNLPISLERLSAYIDRTTGKLTLNTTSTISTIYTSEYYAYIPGSTIFTYGYDVPPTQTPASIQNLKFPVSTGYTMAKEGSWCSVYVTDMTAYDASWNINAVCLRTGVNGNDLYSLNISRLMTTTTVNSIPGVPTGISAQLYPVGNPSGIQFTFTPPTVTGGSISCYEAFAVYNSNIFSQIGTTSPLLVTGLTPGTSYTLTTFSRNAMGQSQIAYASPSTMVYKETPTAPLITSTLLYPAGNPTGIQLTYNAPSKLGGGVESYLATSYWGSTMISYTSTLNGTVTPLTLTGLTPGLTYSFIVNAINNAGTSPSSNQTSLTYRTIPSVPLNVAGALDPIGAANGIVITYDYPSNLGGGVDSYTLKAYDTLSIQSTLSTTTVSSKSVKITTGLVAGTTYRFGVTATNTIGTSVEGQGAPLLFQIPPVTPSITSTSLDPTGNPLGIKVSYTASTSVSGGISYYTTMAYSSNIMVASSISSATTVRVSTLTAGTSYTFKTFATNAAGKGPSSIASEPIVYKTLPSVPYNISGSLYPVGTATGINVAFSYPTDLGGGVDTYTVKAYDTLFTQNTISTTGTTSPLYIGTGLVPGTTYQLRTYATNAGGSSIEGQSASTLLFQIPPLQPNSITASLSTLDNPSSINVAITQPTNTGGGVVTYNVAAYNGSTLVTSQTGDTSTFLYSLSSGITPGTTYSLFASATNTGGTGPVNTTTLTYYTKPDPPTNIAGTLRSVGASTFVDVSFTPSNYSGGGALTYYTIAQDIVSLSTISGSGSSSPITLSSFVPGKTYQFTGYCRNPSVSSIATTGLSNLYYYLIPPAPTGLVTSLNPVGNPTSIQATFNPITTAGGISAYNLYGYLNGTPVVSTSGTNTTYYLSSFVAGNTYTFQANATNPAGTGPFGTSTSLTYYTKPSAPSVTTLSLDPTTTPTGINVAYSAPTDMGGGIVTYTASAYNGATYVTSGTGISPIKITSLTKGINYTFYVTATNPGGATSSIGSALTYYTQPTVVTSLSSSAGLGTVTLTWGAPTDFGGAPSIQYLVTTTGYSSGWITALTATATGLTNGTSYTFTVADRNSAVTTLQNTTTINAIPYGVPNAPTGVTVTPGAGQITISWSAVTSTPAVNLYKVTIASGGTGTNTTASTSYTWTGLTNGTSYTFTVYASNDNGSSYSSGTTSGSASPFGVPAATNVSSTSQGRQSVTLNWTAPVNNGSAITSYDVSSNNGGSWTSAGNVLSYTFGGLSGGTYTLRARAINGVGTGPSGTSGSQTLPAAPTGSTGITSVGFGSNYTTVYYEYNTFTWNSVANATGYILYWRDTYNGGSGSFDVGGSTSQYVNWGDYGYDGYYVGNFYVRVVAYNNGGYGPSGTERYYR
jgi:titin